MTAILDIFKKKEEKKSVEKPIKESPVPVRAKRVKEKRTGQVYGILMYPQITEKATELTKQNQYAFKITARANKTEVKKAIEGLYGVDVLGVKIVKVHAKARRLGRILGWRKGYKKAIVKIKEGQKIEVLAR